MKIKQLLFIGLFTAVLASCGGKASIEKNWALDSYDMSQLMKDVPKEQQPQMQAAVDEMVKSQKGKLTLNMKEGGKLEMNTPDMMNQNKWKKTEGSWKLSSDGKTLTTVTEGKSQDFNVKELTSDKLTLELKEEKMSMSFVPKN